MLRGSGEGEDPATATHPVRHRRRPPPAHRGGRSARAADRGPKRAAAPTSPRAFVQVSALQLRGGERRRSRRQETTWWCTTRRPRRGWSGRGGRRDRQGSAVGTGQHGHPLQNPDHPRHLPATRSRWMRRSTTTSIALCRSRSWRSSLPPTSARWASRTCGWDIQTAGGEDRNHAWSAVGVVGAQGLVGSGRDRPPLGLRRHPPAVERAHQQSIASRLWIRWRSALVGACTTSHRITARSSSWCATAGRPTVGTRSSRTATQWPGPGLLPVQDGRGDDVEAGHKRWVQGVLYDNVVETAVDGTYILLGNRGDWGTQHGWAAAHSVIWNFNRR